MPVDGVPKPGKQRRQEWTKVLLLSAIVIGSAALLVAWIRHSLGVIDGAAYGADTSGAIIGLVIACAALILPPYWAVFAFIAFFDACKSTNPRPRELSPTYMTARERHNQDLAERIVAEQELARFMRGKR